MLQDYEPDFFFEEDKMWVGRSQQRSLIVCVTSVRSLLFLLLFKFKIIFPINKLV